MKLNENSNNFYFSLSFKNIKATERQKEILLKTNQRLLQACNDSFEVIRYKMGFLLHFLKLLNLCFVGGLTVHGNYVTHVTVAKNLI